MALIMAKGVRLAKPVAIFLICVAAAITSLYIFGNHVRTWEDAADYNNIATNLVQHGFFSLDGKSFTVAREPGYPAFLAVIYLFSGLSNFAAVSLMQAILFGMLGFMVYVLFDQMSRPGFGIGAAFAISLFPYYGFYSNEILTETLFTFGLGLTFFLVYQIANLRERTPLYQFILLGAACAATTLVRTQFIFMLPFLIFLWAVFIRTWSREVALRMLAGTALFFVLVGSWVFYVHQNTGRYLITDGRQEYGIFVRADRARLSYADNTRYLTEWLKRSLSGGKTSVFLETHDDHYLDIAYARAVTANGSVREVYKQSLESIFQNPGHYLYGNFIEFLLLLYIEHDFTDSMNKYFRSGIYVLLYPCFAYALYQLFKPGDQRLKSVILLCSLFILYNCALLSFFEVTQRYNTPYLSLFIIASTAGFALRFGKHRKKAWS